MNHENEPLIGSSGRHTHHDVTFFSSFKTTMTSSYFNILLVFVPAALIASYSNASDTIVFSLNFLAIIPLAKLLGFGKATRQSSSLVLTPVF
jgi:Ca2+:H+ antiporter